jgi:hypothetical protein
MDSALSARNYFAHRWYVLLALTAVCVSNAADRFAISTLIEPIKVELYSIPKRHL